MPDSTRWLQKIAALLAALSLSSGAHAALIPPAFANSVVALGSVQAQHVAEGQAPRREWFTEGTGFFSGYLVKDNPDPAKKEYQIFLVTAKHVVQEHLAQASGDLSVRLNPKKSSSQVQEFALPSHGSPGAPTWFFHPNPDIDVALIPISYAFLQERGIEPGVFSSDKNAASRDELIKIGVAAGDGVFVLGFPMDLAGAQRNYVIARQGCIARISELLDRAAPTFMVDAFVFPGNSGGPVVLKPEMTSIVGTKANPTAYLIGIVTSYLAYNDIAVSRQTREIKLVTQENSGLAQVLPTDVINEAIIAWRSSQKTNGGAAN